MNWCYNVLLTLPPVATWELNNNGESGTTCVSMESGVPAEEALDWSPNAPHSVMMLYCGINDITVGGEPPADIWKRQLAICQLTKQAGYEFVTDTTLPSWIDQDSPVQAVNSLIRANWQSCFSGVVDVANDPRLGATGAYANDEYFYLPLPSHLNLYGEQILGGYTSNVLASLYGSTAASPTTVGTSYSELAADNFVKVQSTKAVTVNLPDCRGYVAGHARSVTNAGMGAVSVMALDQQMIDGSADPVSVAQGKTSVFTVQPLSLATAGCTWTTSAQRYAAIIVTAPGQLEVGQSASLEASVSGSGATPTGTVTFASDGVTLGTAMLSSGTATITASSNGIAPSSYPVIATYSGDTNYIPSTSAAADVELMPVQTATSLAASPNPATPPATVMLTATVMRNYGGAIGTPGGNVTFYYGSGVLGSAKLNGSGVATYAAGSEGIAAGSYPITAQYNGDVYDSPSTSAVVSVTLE